MKITKGETQKMPEKQSASEGQSALKKQRASEMQKMPTMGTSLKALKTRILAVCLSVALGLGCLPVTAAAAEEPEVTVTKLEELAEPTQFPTKGTLQIQIAKSKSVDSAGNVTLNYEDAYLSVLVDEQKQVYAELDVIAAQLGMTPNYYGSSIEINVNDTTTTIYMELGNLYAGYRTSLYEVSIYDAIIYMGTAPIIYEDVWYVPLDAFLKVTGSDGIYNGESALEKKILKVVPPQKTVMDDIADFYQNAYRDYVFNFTKDLGYTQENVAKMAGTAAAVEYIDGLFSLDWRSWYDLANLCILGDASFEHYETAAIDNFMDYLLKVNTSTLDSMAESNNAGLDFLDLVFDITASETAAYVGEMLPGAKQLSADLNTVYKLSQSQEVLLSAQNADKWLGQLNAYQTTLKTVDGVNIGAKALGSYLSLYSSLSGVNEKSKTGAEYFSHYWNALENPAINADNMERVRKNISQFDASKHDVALEKYFEQNTSILGLDLMKFSDMPMASEISWVSLGYGIAAGTILKEGLDQTEAMTTASFGLQYEIDVMNVTFQIIEQYMEESKTSVGSSITEEKLRAAVYHAMAACFVTRYLGVAACAHTLEDMPNLVSQQERINNRLAAMMGRMVDDNVSLGIMPKNLANLRINNQIHYENVVFNLCEIQGQILSMEDEKPAKNVEVTVVDEEGNSLFQFKTDREGYFDEAFELENVDPFSSEPLLLDLTLHMKYKRYEEILEQVQVQIFQNSRIDGLRVGEKKEELIGFLKGAREENGQVILDIQRITLDEDTIYFDMQEWGWDMVDYYTPLPGQATVSSEIERLILDEDVTFETVYSLMAPEGSLVHGLVGILDAYDASYFPAALIESELHDAGEIQAFIDAYVDASGGMYPTFEIEKVNSVIRGMYPNMIMVEP